MPGSDGDLLLNRLLPMLPSGVFVHIHDMFLPYGYPQGWAWCRHNEQLGVVAVMLNGSGWDPAFSSLAVV
jgi:hypothetical protein